MAKPDNIPNFDAMDPADLSAWIENHTPRTQARVEELMGDRRELGRWIYHQLTRYAKAKFKAMGLRLEGKIQAARELENHCDSIYASLPEICRW